MAKDFTTINNANLPLGLRNNNPGNVRSLGANKLWVGQTGANKGFAVFSDIGYGIRAMVKNAITQIQKNGKDTVAKYVVAYAPPKENDTKKYIAVVAKALGLNANDKIPVTFDTLQKLVRVQMQLEIGKHSELVTDADITDGFLKLS